MKLLKVLFFILIVAAVFSLSNGVVWATTSAQALFTETNLGGGLWEYDYTLYNTSDPGYDLYDFTLYLAPAVTFTNIPWPFPPGWGPPFTGSGDPLIPLSSFIEWSPDFGGGAEITPGGSLSGFSFQVSYQAGDLPFDVYFTYPSGEPVLYSGTTAASSAVPEPGTLILLGSGLAGVGFFRRKRLFKLGTN